MNKENRKEIEKVLEERELAIAKKRLSFVAKATGIMGAVKVGGILLPKAVTVCAATTTVMGLAIPGYFTIAIVAGVICTGYSGYKIEKNKLDEEKAKKAKEGKVNPNDLFKLED